ncbi:hypothetical protein ACE7GA_27030 (plasmid) [Roseomonas sp. CCTCC AB2023176]|uniref:hypothetical protein n=1 Tax=Roseomonas sp. CCTCC AB2023176 TaxID=3342640 RepID=UPI0035DFAA04
MPPFPNLDGLTPEERDAAVRRHGVAMDLWRLQVTTLTELAKVGAEASRHAVGQALVVNAGGGVALLTLIGNLVGRGGMTLEGLLPRVGPALLAYATGVMLAVLVSVCITLSHNAALGLRVTASNRWRGVAAVLFGMSLGAFGVGTAIAAVVLLAPGR